MNENMNEIVDQFENALSVMTTQAYAMTEGGFGSADDIDFMFDVLDGHGMKMDVIPRRYEEDIDIINIRAKDLSGENPSNKIIRIKDALYIMANYIRRICKEAGSLEAGDCIIAGILESNDIWENYQNFRKPWNMEKSELPV